MSQADSSTVTEQQAEAYEGLLRPVERKAEEIADAEGADGVYAKHVRDAVSDFFENITVDTALLTAILVQSEEGPFKNWQMQQFDTDDPEGALRALAASAITSDIMARQ